MALKLNKKQFADRMAENSGMTKKAAFHAVGAFWDTVIECLGEDETVSFNGIGKFRMQIVGEKRVRNPKTEERYIVPAHKKIRFFPSGTMADKIGKK